MNLPATVEAPKAVSINKAAELLGISRSSVYKLFNDGQLRWVHVGSRRVIPLSALNELLGETGA